MKLIFIKTLIVFSTIKTADLINRKKSKCIQMNGLQSTWNEKNFDYYLENDKILDIGSKTENS